MFVPIFTSFGIKTHHGAVGDRENFLLWFKLLKLLFLFHEPRARAPVFQHGASLVCIINISDWHLWSFSKSLGTRTTDYVHQVRTTQHGWCWRFCSSVYQGQWEWNYLTIISQWCSVQKTSQKSFHQHTETWTHQLTFCRCNIWMHFVDS